MAAQAGANVREIVATSAPKTLVGRRWFESAYFLATFWIVGGSYADAWAHSHIARLETFFTPWHAVLYSGYLVTALVMFGTIIINRVRGATWTAAIPQGYALSMLGVIGFFFGGIGDLLWHTLFGVEQNVDALLSPTHILLMISFGLMVIGPYRARYRRREQLSTLEESIFLTLACSLFLVAVSAFTQSTSPYLLFWPQTADSGQVLAQATHPGVFWPQTLRTVQDVILLQAVEGYVVQVVLFVGMTLYTIRRFRLPLGFFACVQTVVAFPLGIVGNHLIVIPIALLAGLLIDGAYHLLRPSMTDPVPFRLFAAISACALYLVYMLALQLLGGITWSVHMAVGSVVITGVIGWLLSYLVLPAPLAEPVK